MYPSQLSPMGKVGSRVAPASLHSSGSISNRGQLKVDLVLASSCSNQFQCDYMLESPLHLGALGLNAFNHLWAYQVSYVFHSLA